MIWWGVLAILWGLVSLRLADMIVANAVRFFDMSDAPKDWHSRSERLGVPAYLASALVFMAPILLLEEPAVIVLLLMVMTLCLWTALLDWRAQVVPDLFVVGLGVVALLQAIVLGIPLWDPFVAGVGSALLIAALLVGGALWRQGALPSLDGLAWGDVTLIAGLGALVGVAALPVFWFLIGPAHLAFHLVTRRGRRALREAAPLPMAPALCVAGVLSLLASHAGFDWMGIVFQG